MRRISNILMQPGQMALRLGVSGANKRDLEVIRGEGPERLGKILVALKGLGKQPVTLTEIYGQVAKNTSSDDAARIITQQLFMLSGLRRKHSYSVKEIVDALSSGAQDAGWTNEDLNQWAQVSELFGELLGCDSINVLAKTANLGVDYSNRLRFARILTDIRPIFDDGRDKIVGGIATNVMRLEYWNEEGDHSISIALDRSDVESLLQPRSARVEYRTAGASKYGTVTKARFLSGGMLTVFGATAFVGGASFAYQDVALGAAVTVAVGVALVGSALLRAEKERGIGV